MKKILAFILALSTLTLFCSCKGRMYRNVTYKEGGISFTLPNTMRRVPDSEYDFYFTNRSIVFTANELDEEFFEENDIDENITAEEYAKYCIEKNGLDIEKMNYKTDEERGLYNFRYNYDDENGTNLFYYVVIAGEVGNVWYIEMCCDNDDSQLYISTFGDWKRGISTYSE